METKVNMYYILLRTSNGTNLSCGSDMSKLDGIGVGGKTSPFRDPLR